MTNISAEKVNSDDIVTSGGIKALQHQYIYLGLVYMAVVQQCVSMSL